MVGTIVSILVQPGVRVTEADVLLILESMKIHVPVQAPRASTVQEIRVSAGDTVQEDDLLMVLA